MVIVRFNCCLPLISTKPDIAIMTLYCNHHVASLEKMCKLMKAGVNSFFSRP